MSKKLRNAFDPLNPQPLVLFNPYHGPDGRFSSSGGEGGGSDGGKSEGGTKSGGTALNSKPSQAAFRASNSTKGRGAVGHHAAAEAHRKAAEHASRVGDHEAATAHADFATRHADAAKAAEHVAKIAKEIESKMTPAQRKEESKAVKAEKQTHANYTDARAAALNASKNAKGKGAEEHAKAETAHKEAAKHALNAGDASKAAFHQSMAESHARVAGLKSETAAAKKKTKDLKALRKSLKLSHAVALDIISEHTPWVLSNDRTDAEGKPTNKYVDENGVEHHLYKKSVLRMGDFVKEQDGLKFSINEKSMEHFANTFKDMNEHGVDVFTPLGHTEDSDKNKGKIVGMQRNGEFLDAIFDLTGKDAPELVANNDVSVFVPPDFVDGKGRRYVRPIRHVALTPCPVIPGLGKWEAVAASFQKKEVVFMKWDAIQKALGIETTLTDENADSLLIPAIEKLKTDNAALSLSMTPKKADPVTVELMVDNRKMHLDTLVDKCRLTPACRDKFMQSRFGNPEKLALTLSHGGDDGFKEFMAILAENDTVALHEKTGPQGVALSNDPNKEVPKDKDGKPINPMMQAMDKLREQQGCNK